MVSFVITKGGSLICWLKVTFFFILSLVQFPLCVYYTLLYPKQGNIVIVRLSPPTVKCNSMPDQTNSPVISVLQNYFLDQLSSVKKKEKRVYTKDKVKHKG